MEEQHIHCLNCVSRRCMARPETGVSCELIGCPLVCGAIFHSCKIDEHRLLCPLERVPCLNSDFGCPFLIARNKLAEHLSLCPASVVCCTMEWNRWPVSYADQKSYENLSKEVDEVEQLDMALALQDQRMLLESLKVATMVSKTAEKQSGITEKTTVTTSIPEEKPSNGLIAMDEESYNELYLATVETTRSLAAALDILSNATKDMDLINGTFSGDHSERNGQVLVNEMKDLNVQIVEMKDSVDDNEAELGAVGGAEHKIVTESLNEKFSWSEHNGFVNILGDLDEEQIVNSMDMVNDKVSFCNGFHSVGRQQDSDHDEMDLDTTIGRNAEMKGSWELQEPDKQIMPLYSIPLDLQQISESHLPPVSEGQQNFGVLHHSSDFGDRRIDRKLHSLQVLRSMGVFNGHRLLLADPFSFRAKMEDKAVDTSDLEVAEDPMGLHGIDLITAALLFCLGDSPGGRGISDSRFVDGYRIDFGTQTFSFPSAILATNTMVGEIASASACDHANPQLSNPSPFQTLRLDLVLECVARYQTKQRSMFTFVCGQLFRRDEFSSHFKNVHGDIHAGLNGWMEHRCPLAYYGCTYSQRRFCPSVQGSKVIHDRHLRSFGVQPRVFKPLTESIYINFQFGSRYDYLSTLPFEVLQHIAGFLDGFSLCQLSRVSRLMRDVCASLLQVRGMVILLWEKRQYSNSTSSWQIKNKVWKFSTAFGTVNEWKFANIANMADHLKKCKFNTVEKREEAIPLPCMCVTRELTKEGRSLRSVLKPVL
ncbi:F-box only protein 30a [Erpetoichthys calabaricus]|uniref:F-box protein 30a n=1 Tax=Erpetoichthys calabaricus TaxID=27687 RepID=A0A8C4RIP9_ERPCA|nr:F-box only protein 30a [Erpetoichthys calabaricus]